MLNDYDKATLFCENCKEETKVIENKREGEVSCSVCGMIISDHLVDQTSEWRTFSSDDNENTKNRVGAPVNPLLNGGGLSTIIGRKDFKGNTVTNMDSGIGKIQQATSLSSMDRSMVSAMSEIRSICGRMGMEDQTVYDLSCQIYKEIITRNLLRGRNSEAMKVVCVYISCRVEGLNRSIKEICDIMGLEKKVFNKTFAFLKKKMSLKLEIISMERFVIRFCAALEMPQQDTNAVNTVVETITRGDLLEQGKNPVTIVAVAIYYISFLSGVKLDYKRISEVCSISESTIRHAYNELYPRMKTLLPTNWQPKVPVTDLPVPPPHSKK